MSLQALVSEFQSLIAHRIELVEWSHGTYQLFHQNPDMTRGEAITGPGMSYSEAQSWLTGAIYGARNADLD